MSVPTITGVPRQITAGTSAAFTMNTTTDYPASSWTGTFIAGMDGTTPAIQKVGTNSNGSFLFALSTAETSLLPGIYNYWLRATNGSDAVLVPGGSGTFRLEPNPLIALPLSLAAQQLVEARAVLTTLAANPNQSVSFNGQSFSVGSRMDLINLIAYLESIVTKEQNALKSGDPYRIVTQFVPADGGIPFRPPFFPFC